MRGSRRRVLLGSLAGAAVAAVLAVAALQTGDGEPRRRAAPATTASSPAAVTPSASEIPTWEGPTPPPVDMRLAKGSAQAPVTIVEFGDFKCPNCRRYAREIAPVLQREYVDTGVVRMFWRDYPIRGRESVAAARAARAAAAQGRFWEFHDALYAGGTGLGGERLRAAARSAGLDVARFDRDRRSAEVRGMVEADEAFAYQLGLPGTPAFLINGELLFGAQPVSAFRDAIEKARRAG